MLEKTRKLVIYMIVFSVISLLFYHPQITKAATILFQDNFDGGSTSNWIVIGDPGWNIQTNQYGIHLDPGLSNTLPSDSAWNYNWTNIAYDVDLIGNAGVDKNILLKFHDTSNFIEIHANDGGIFLDKAGAGGGTLAYVPTQLQNDVRYHFRSEINNDRIKVFLDNVLIFDVNETAPWITNWKIGLRAGTGAVHPTEVYFDNVLVTDLSGSTPMPSSSPIPTPAPTSTPPSLPDLNVPDVKQYSLPWASQIYDHAILWTNNPIINRWGCALTAADMILQYYGFPIDPGNLNTWLNSQADGYVDGGLLNWLAISRYSKTHATNNQPSLEFLRLANTNQNLINQLTLGRPAILEEPGHFILAKSQTQTSFGINDPAYSNRPTLASYGNSFNSIEAYTPSHTDLSYIMLTINPKFYLKVYDTNNQEITGDTFIQNPLVDDVDNSSSSGSPLKIFMFAKPVNGDYKVQVGGDGIYELSSYLYDVNGNVSSNKTKGLADPNDSDKFTITIGQTNSVSQNVTIDSIIKDWNNARSAGKIKSAHVYNQVGFLLEIVNKLYAMHFVSTSKEILRLTIQIIKIFTPKEIDPDFSNIIQSEIKTLVNPL